ncbi:hypothetical protein PR202_ga12102 [Eleusine coracana subsp. coracana]|uniref:Uncharacterized protein n=1 Tax=Eleusine coracana subsp. coracana TaxID=191504 RepID=A0AAV5CB79_ELECO|nr:hypothetical protein PR202_ga12102 [Eleusine coracana subsp. coracana]
MRSRPHHGPQREGVCADPTQSQQIRPVWPRVRLRRTVAERGGAAARVKCGTAIGCAESPRGCAHDGGHRRGDGGSASSPGDDGDGRWRQGRFGPGRRSKAVDGGCSFFGYELQRVMGSIGIGSWSAGAGLKVLSAAGSEQSSTAVGRNLQWRTRRPTRKERGGSEERVGCAWLHARKNRTERLTVLGGFLCGTSRARCGRRWRRSSIELGTGGGWWRGWLEWMEELLAHPWVGWTPAGRRCFGRAAELGHGARLCAS